MLGYKFGDDVVSNFWIFLVDWFYKNVWVIYFEIGVQGKFVYLFDDIYDFEENNRWEFIWKKELVVYFLFFDGGYLEDLGDLKVLGVVYYNIFMVIFVKSIDDLLGGFGQFFESFFEIIVVNYEFGYIFGLVNIGSFMQNYYQDVIYGVYCFNQDCLMYWEVESGDVVSNLFGMIIVFGFDVNCILDLQVNGGRQIYYLYRIVDGF